MNKLFIAIIISSALCSIVASVQAQGKTYFRYKNEQGVQVMSDAIPVEYASKGYQIVDLYGRVVKEIPPELSEEEKARLSKELEEKQRIEENDKSLLARYSHVDDIQASKKRRLREVDTNIFTLQLTLNNLITTLKTLQADAANQERAGRNIAKDLLDNIAQLQKDKSLIQEEILQKRQDKVNIEQRYNADMERFMIIKPESAPTSVTP